MNEIRFDDDPHAFYTLKVAQWLKEKHPKDDVRTYFQKYPPHLTLTNGNNYEPDIWNKSEKKLYEIHYSGVRKEEEFRNLPVGWQGINVFYNEYICPFTLVIKEKSHNIVQLIWSSEEIKYFPANSYYREVYLKNIDKMAKLDLEKNPHLKFILLVHFWNQKMFPDDRISSDINMAKSGNSNILILKNGDRIRPDVQNKTRNYIYEVHYRGERKTENFYLLPEGSSGVNVFYDEEQNSECIIIRERDFKILRIKW